LGERAVFVKLMADAECRRWRRCRSCLNEPAAKMKRRRCCRSSTAGVMVTLFWKMLVGVGG